MSSPAMIAASAQNAAIKHRNDIDGLRAVAVLPILLFHAGVERLSGGFIGVDIFFVISGYLITMIIQREMMTGRFSLLQFYQRRITRIFPALFVLLAFVLILGSRLLFPSELASLGLSSAATTGFVSNLYFWKTAGYFDTAAESKILLHTWSLGVEEQFYLFYPLLLMLLLRFWRAHLRTAIILLVIGSFVISVAATIKVPNSAFYLLPSRAWELGIGAMVALNCWPKLSGAMARSAASIAGLLLIATGLLFIRSDMGFPAPAALLPCVGAALLIAYGQGSVTENLLSWKVMRWIGAISYSLYLWHWPLITFYRIEYGFVLDTQATLLLIAASIAAATLSYYLVEQPFLRKFRSANPRMVVSFGAASLIIVALLSMWAAKNAANIVNVPPKIAQLAAFADYAGTPAHLKQTDKGRCFTGDGEIFNIDRCFRPVAGQRNILLLGDSHASQYAQALKERFPADHFVQITVSGCRPIMALIGEPRCTSVIDEIYRNRLPQSGISSVILAARWKPEELDATLATIKTLLARGLKVTVIGPTAEYGGTFPLMVARQQMRGNAADLSYFLDQNRFTLDAKLAAMVQKTGAQYYSEIDAECPSGVCRLTAADGSPYHFDYGHLTASAAKEVIAHLPAP